MRKFSVVRPKECVQMVILNRKLGIMFATTPHPRGREDAECRSKTKSSATNVADWGEASHPT